MKPQVIFLSWLPASGKSTYAKEICAKHPNFIRVNKDDIRAMMTSEFSKPREDIVIAMRDQAIVSAVEKWFGVVIDDTNFEPKHKEQVLELIRNRKSTEFVEKFFDVPLSVCLERNRKRLNPVPDDVIISMAKRYNIGKELNEFAPVVQDDLNPPAIIVDIDGTLAKMNGRWPFDWSRVWEDLPHEDIVALVKILEQEHYVLFVSWRDEICRAETQSWLDKQWLEWTLYMRKESDNRKDSIVKYEILQDLIRIYYISYVIDDRDQVVKMWRQAWLRCLQVAEWAF